MSAFVVDVHHGLSGCYIGKVQVAPEHTIREVKQLLEGASRTPARYQILFHEANSELKDAETVASVGLKQGAVLNLCYSKVQPLDIVESLRDGVSNVDDLRYMLAHNADINAKVDGTSMKPNIADDPSDAKDKHMLSIGMFQASALHHAAYHGLTEVCRFLLETVEFTETNYTMPADGESGEEVLSPTALHVAALSGYSDICLLLLKSPRFTRVDDDISPFMGAYDMYYHRRSALTIACVKGLPDVVQMLLRDPRCTGLNRHVDYYGTTVLILAASRKSTGNARVCQIIINDPRFELMDSKCAQYGCLGGNGGNAHDFAKHVGLSSIVDMLDSLDRNKKRREYQSQQLPRKNQVPQQAQHVPGMPPAEEVAANQSIHGVAKSVPFTVLPSTLVTTEKDFLKAIKNFRVAQKLEEKKQRGDKLDPLQERKLDRKNDMLRDLRGAFMLLPEASDLRTKNLDVIAGISDE
eukprot:gnl/TRDRNA2_/TRDRNA2_93887_c0_seq1.p1 gnl/TRDRNA2_/TRDRNA2_93887_c0~~gnl/TRDRNA2_/TRDRNA2_93887_c0_seq1.p1  ORF type:complete len:467 (+),score=69.44 gnl/TRDRNA2_/TRDRNA2_93887_c0_seq1:15-1415(+)